MFTLNKPTPEQGVCADNSFKEQTNPESGQMITIIQSNLLSKPHMKNEPQDLAFKPGFIDYLVNYSLI